MEVEGSEASDGSRDLLSVGSDVLDGAAADEPRDASEALNAAEALPADDAHEAVPVVPSAHLHVGVIGGFGDAVAEGHVEDHARETGVGNEEVGAASEHEDREGAGAGEAYGFEEFVFGSDAAEEAGRAPDAEGGVWR